MNSFLPTKSAKIVARDAKGDAVGGSRMMPSDPVVSEATKLDTVSVFIKKRETELEQYHSLYLAAVMVGGPVGEAVRRALEPLHSSVAGRAEAS